jgi:integrase
MYPPASRATAAAICRSWLKIQPLNRVIWPTVPSGRARINPNGTMTSAKRPVGWGAATVAAGLAGFRVHDLRHTAASVWLGAGADPKVVQRAAFD